MEAALEEEEDAVALDADETAAAVEEDGAAAAVEELDSSPPVGVSPERTQPVLSVRALGQVTCWYVTAGLSAPSKKSPKRKLQPGCRALGKVSQVLLEIPPY